MDRRKRQRTGEDRRKIQGEFRDRTSGPTGPFAELKRREDDWEREHKLTVIKRIADALRRSSNERQDQDSM